MQDQRAPRTLAELFKVPDHQMTKQEKLLRYGHGNAAVMKYAKVTRDGKEQVVRRTFQPGETIPENWKDSPADFGVETEPNHLPKTEEDFEGVVAVLPAAAAPAAPAAEGEAAAAAAAVTGGKKAKTAAKPE